METVNREVHAVLIRPAADILPSEITPREVYLNRRQLMGGAAGLALGSGCLEPRIAAALTAAKSPFSTDEKLTSREDVTTYNNYYEFGVDKAAPAKYAHTLKTAPWTVKVDGLVGEARRIRARGPHQILRPRGADLPHAVRRGLVDGHSVGRVSAR